MFRLSLIISFAIALGTANLVSQTAEKTPQFKEVFEILKTKLPNITESQLEKAALNGILTRFSNYVHIVTDSGADNLEQPSLKTQFFESNIVYFRIGAVCQGLSEQFSETLKQIVKTNDIKGLILDLRFSTGKDYESAAKFADLFYNEEKPLFKLDEKLFKSTTKTNAIALPTIVLINKETANSAEALVYSLMNCKSVITIGNHTSGTAHSFVDYKLSSGHILRVAAAPIKTPDDTPIPTNGLAPDIVVNTPIDDERDFIENPFKLPKRLESDSKQTAFTTRPRLNEAELVRMKKEGIDITGDLPLADKTAKPTEAQQKIIHDPALARAVDILKVISLIGMEKFRK